MHPVSNMEGMAILDAGIRSARKPICHPERCEGSQRLVPGTYPGRSQIGPIQKLDAV